MTRHRHPLIRFLGLEDRRQPIATPAQFNRRLLRVTGATFLVLALWLAVGIAGYSALGHMGFVDALYNASMIAGGMGPVLDPDFHPSVAFKVFASFYALTSGVVLIAAVGVMLTPLLHRILHRFHVEAGD